MVIVGAPTPRSSNPRVAAALLRGSFILAMTAGVPARADDSLTVTGAALMALHPFSTTSIVLEEQRATFDCTGSRPTTLGCTRAVAWTLSNPTGEPARATFRAWGDPVFLDGRSVPLRAVGHASYFDVELPPGARARLDWTARGEVHFERWMPDGPIEHLHLLSTGSPGQRRVELIYSDGLSPNQRQHPAWTRRGQVIVEVIVPASWIPIAEAPSNATGTGYVPRGALEPLTGGATAPAALPAPRWGTSRRVVRCAADAEWCGMRFRWETAASTGGPFVGLGVGAVPGGAGVRARLGWEFGLTRSAILALAVDTDFAARLRPAATLSVAKLGLPIFERWHMAPPGVLLGGGVVVDALPSPRAGGRLVATLFGWVAGLEWSLDLFPGESIAVESTLLVRMHL